MSINESIIKSLAVKYDVDEEVAKVMSEDIIQIAMSKKDDNKSSSPRMGRPITEESKRVRDALLVMRHGIHQPVTAPRLAKVLKADTSDVNNTLRWLEGRGMAKMLGPDPTYNQRGRVPNLWKLKGKDSQARA